MEPQKWTTVDKSEWGDGPWQIEPDKVVWVDAATDLDCMAHRSPSSGAWCGYVGVPNDHPAHGKSYDEVEVDVHGGLTYGNTCDDEATEENGLCHVPLPGRPHDVFWLGFDCAHSMDLAPAMESRYKEMGMSSPMMGTTYRTLVYVMLEVASLAHQLKEAA